MTLWVVARVFLSSYGVVGGGHDINKRRNYNALLVTTRAFDYIALLGYVSGGLHGIF